MTNERFLNEATLQSSKCHQIHQWCGNSNQKNLKVVEVIFTKGHVRKYCENIFAGKNVPNRFQGHFQAQSQVRMEGKGNHKRAILRASEQTNIQDG